MPQDTLPPTVRRSPRDVHDQPVGRRGQLAALAAVLSRSASSLEDARQGARRAMVDEDLDDGRRRAAVGRLRTVAWRLRRDVLPLVDRVPAALRTDPGYTDCLRVAHALCRSVDAAMTENANDAINLAAGDLVGRGSGPGRR